MQSRNENGQAGGGLWTRMLWRTSACAILTGHFLMAGGMAQAQTELLFATTLPESSPLIEQVFGPWVNDLNEAGEGVLSVRMENGPIIASHTNVYERVNSGLIDMGWGILASAGAPFPRIGVSALPFLVKDSPAGSAALWSVYQEGLFDDDFTNVKMLSLVALPVAGLHSTVPIAALEDMAGLKLRSADRISSDLLSALGATPVSIATAESYQSVEQGVVSGLFVGWTGLALFRLEEVTTDHLNVNLGSGGAGIFINRQIYDGLSEEAKAVLDDAGAELVGRLSGWYGKVDGIFEQQVAALPGQTVRSLSPEEEALWKERSQPVIDAWVAETPDGAEILAAFRAALPDAES